MTTDPGPPAVFTRFQRTDPEIVRKLGAFGASTVHEANRRLGFMRGIHPRVPGAKICGTAVTSLDHSGDNIMAHAAIASAQPGDVLVITTKSLSEHGMFGDLMAESSRARGIVGVVCASGVRDVAQLREMPFPAWSRAVTCDGTAKSNPGWANVPVVIGEQLVRPGDVIIADDDGVVVVPREAAADTLAAAESREAREAAMRARLAQGELSFDISGHGKALREMGVLFPDDPDR